MALTRTISCHVDGPYEFSYGSLQLVVGMFRPFSDLRDDEIMLANRAQAMCWAIRRRLNEAGRLSGGFDE